MPIKIKKNYGPRDIYHLPFIALQAGGSVLNGATTLNQSGNGTYHSRPIDMGSYRDTFVLGDKWFNSNPHNIDTVRDAVERATGIRLKFASQMLSSDPANIPSYEIVSYEIVNQELYDATLGRQMQVADIELCRSLRG